MGDAPEAPTTTFSTERVNATTFVIRENDAFFEHPFIYAKLHPKADVLILSDTGCDAPWDDIGDANFTHLRDYLENCPIEANDDRPLNPNGARQYIIICTHCHFDHIGGISQFSKDDRTRIVASAAGRDFIESDLQQHGIFDEVGRKAPKYKITHWAQAFEKLTHPVNGAEVDLGITILHTPGHTPDQLAFYDSDERHLYVGDSMYEEGAEDVMPIIWPKEGNLIEWEFSRRKMLCFVRSENTRLRAGKLPTVQLGAGHQTHSIDAEKFLETCGTFFERIMRGEIPIKSEYSWRDELNCHWREEDGRAGISFSAPKRLMEEAKQFFFCEPRQGMWARFRRWIENCFKSMKPGTKFKS